MAMQKASWLGQKADCSRPPRHCHVNSSSSRTGQHVHVGRHDPLMWLTDRKPAAWHQRQEELAPPHSVSTLISRCSGALTSACGQGKQEWSPGVVAKRGGVQAGGGGPPYVLWASPIGLARHKGTPAGKRLTFGMVSFSSPSLTEA